MHCIEYFFCMLTVGLQNCAHTCWYLPQCVTLAKGRGSLAFHDGAKLSSQMKFQDARDVLHVCPVLSAYQLAGQGCQDQD